MTEQQTRLQQLIEVNRRANVVATTTDTATLQDQMLSLIVEVTQAQAGFLYRYSETRNELTLSVVAGLRAEQRLVGQRYRVDQGWVTRTLQQEDSVVDTTIDPDEAILFSDLADLRIETHARLPLIAHKQLIGVIQLVNVLLSCSSDAEDMVMAQLLCDRLATEIQKNQLLADARRREWRQQALVDIISHITTTLERDKLLDRIMNYATSLLEVEATSIWLQDEQTGDLVLQTASGYRSERMRQVRVPAGKGIIGYVMHTGERVLVSNVHDDNRFYHQIDQQSGFVTRSILCVPLRAPKIELGGDQGEVEATIIGGAQALNKRNGEPFSAEDISLFETLASQAATVLQLAKLYERNSKLFFGIIHAVTEAIDLKDPYTRGHSQRVADFSVAIAKELDLSQAMIYHIRIGGILHDVGKIGVRDTILQKPDHLTEAEMDEMKQHPLHGVRILEKAELATLLPEECAALAQHHERLDGRGYPEGLQGDQITQIGRIVAVADAFDAMTSTRPYRPGMPIAQALHILRNAAGTEYDAACVDALIRAHDHGLIKVQHERHL